MKRSCETLKPTKNLFNTIVTLLNSKRVDFRVIDHPPIDGSASGSSEVTGTRPEQGAKSLVMMASELPIMVVVRGPDRVDFKAVKEATSSKNVRMATLAEVEQTTNSDVGTLPPIGSLFNIQTYFDQTLIDEGEIAFGTGSRTSTIVMRADKLVRVFKPIVGKFSRKKK